jgi:signal transduction histidine kinase
LIFQFKVIKEDIAESLIEDRAISLTLIADELESLNSKLTKVLETPLVPGDFKISIMNQVDLAGIVLLLRKIDHGGKDRQLLMKLNRDVRILGDRLYRFERVLVEQAKLRLVNFQKMMIGSLAMVICVITIILTIWYRKVGVPLFFLSSQVKEVISNGGDRLTLHNGWAEITSLYKSFNLLLEDKKNLERTLDFRLASEKTEELIWNLISKCSARQDVFDSLCKMILTKQDYCLAWFGEPDPTGKEILPVSVDGSTIMDEVEYNRFLEILITSDRKNGEFSSPEMLAFEQEKQIIERNIFSSIPKGHLKNIPLKAESLSCLILPVIWREQCFGVLSVYSTAETSFTDNEITWLTRIAEISALLCFSFEQPEKSMKYDFSMQICSLAAIGELSTGLAHEINNLINGIINYSQLLVDECIVSDNKHESELDLLNRVIKDGEYIALIIKQLLFVNRRHKQGKKPVLVSIIIKNYFTLLENQLKSDGISLKLALDENCPPVDLNVQQLEQAIVNLFNNSRYALNQRFPGQDKLKQLFVSTAMEQNDEKKLFIIRIIDWGGGVEPSFLERIFDPFYSSKPVNEGTGLGLTISRMLIEENNGELAIESSDNETTTAIIKFQI